MNERVVQILVGARHCHALTVYASDLVANAIGITLLEADRILMTIDRI